MTPIEFDGYNIVIAKDQPEYLQLPAHRVPEEQAFNSPDPVLRIEGRLTCCWQLTWRERWKLLRTGRLWFQTLTFYHPLQPILPLVDKPELDQ